MSEFNAWPARPGVWHRLTFRAPEHPAGSQPCCEDLAATVTATLTRGAEGRFRIRRLTTKPGGV